MIYRLLGAVSVFVGAVFGLVALAVLIPFLNSFSGSLLILIAVFGIIGWVFLAIGWQLLRPPKPSASAEFKAEDWVRDAGGSSSVTEGSPGAPTPNGGPSVASGGLGSEEGSADEETDVVLGSGFATFDVVAPGAEDEVQPEDEGLEHPDGVGLSIDERLSVTRGSFKKPYQSPEDQGDSEA